MAENICSGPKLVLLHTSPTIMPIYQLAFDVLPAFLEGLEDQCPSIQRDVCIQSGPTADVFYNYNTIIPNR
jgi:hypothetical protein